MFLFYGHTFPGTAFCLLGTWWLYKIWLKYFICLRSNECGVKCHSRYTNTASFQCPCCPRIPFEGLMKIIITSSGMLGAYVRAYEDGELVHYNNLQHMTMFFFFCLNGVVDVMVFYKVPLPQGTDYASFSLAFCVEGLLFFYHLHDRSPLDVLMHKLLLYAVTGCVVAFGTEAKYKGSVLAGLSRCYFNLLQGTWFLQIAYVLYWPSGNNWRQDNHEEMMVITILYCWHNAGIFLFMMLVGGFTYWRVKLLSIYQTLPPPPLLTKTSGALDDSMDTQHIRNIVADSEEEDEVV